MGFILGSSPFACNNANMKILHENNINLLATQKTAYLIGNNDSMNVNVGSTLN